MQTKFVVKQQFSQCYYKFSENSLKGSVMLVVNALFFKGTWDRQPFSEKATRIGKFYPTKISSVDVPMMHSYGRFYYSSSTELDAKILRIPYSVRKKLFFKLTAFFKFKYKFNFQN